MDAVKRSLEKAEGMEKEEFYRVVRNIRKAIREFLQRHIQKYSKLKRGLLFK